ncbi:CAMK family protein kinase [Trichomonas vaginalis G3]|uniref:CAMK family protein kinase n=1 Tax=Trichomonas vaginalis (strain ATCC PRA-98 / G3) TaxID=412133 RepID=A2EZ66_TRIV3|nr:protein serine/threonine kinase protein [Trichomonas vaginalis G3]EAY02054.1 CAMK family protein kinase [Trichomonas vaginalis G3]KAI5514285.1 protein serine/threonine kinase protein [Trichomonas vaginalis G3]|eukprot:XP_001330508.1 CAMK family protein kinase [Trichomonas vaginalis G3]
MIQHTTENLHLKFNKNEIDCMKEVDNNNIVRLYDYDYYDGSVYLMMEFCPTSLDKFIRKKRVLTREQLLKYSYGVLKSIKACHRFNVAHLDIKPANFLIDNYDRIRVCDFGFSAIHQDEHLEENCEGSVPFMPPEVILGHPHDPFKADVWAIGVTFFIMSTGKFPWEGDDRKTLCDNLLKEPPRTELIQCKDYAEVIEKCLAKDPNERPSIDELLELPLFKTPHFDFKPAHRNSMISHLRAMRHRSLPALIVSPVVCRSRTSL